MQLQNQYRDCLEIIGVGHAQAETEQRSEQEYFKRQELNKNIAKERGLKAEQKLKEEKKEKSNKVDEKKQYKNASKNIENTRSALVSDLSRKRKSKSPFKKKRKRKLVSVEVDQESESELDSDIPLLLNLSSSASTESKISDQQRELGVISSATSINSVVNDVPSTSQMEMRKKLEGNQRKGTYLLFYRNSNINIICSPT